MTVISNKKSETNIQTFNQPNLQPGDVTISIDPIYSRPTEVDLLIGDYSKAKQKLEWEPKVKFEELIKIMVKADLEKTLKRGF